MTLSQRGRCQFARRARAFLYGIALGTCVVLTADAASLSQTTLADVTTYPLTADPTGRDTPKVMLALGRDHQYWFEAYDDLSDVDDNGLPDTGYEDGFTYFGYFHSRRCYRYQDASGRYAAAGVSGGTHEHHCVGPLADAWSGNFLNWATMTRLDVLRKLLYGGRRVIDTPTLTVLERAGLPHDGHSFAKYYNGPDLALLTPFDSLRTDTSNGGDADGIDDADEGLTLCNTTRATSGSSQATTAPPLLRAVGRNYQLWAANERWQCTFENENGDNVNGNDPALSGLFAATSDPPASVELTTPGGARDHIVRVAVCEAAHYSAADDLERCRSYAEGRLKPGGILQEFGAQMDFGLVSGSYSKNLSGGRLRKNVGPIANEIQAESGVFLVPPAGGGIIANLEAWRLYGYGYAGGTYLASSGGGDDCPFQLASITEGRCASWGQPLAEIYLEALRYFSLASGRAPSAAFNGSDQAYLLGLTNATWTEDPLAADNGCEAAAILTISGGANTHDGDQTVSEAFDGPALTTAVGAADGLNGMSLFVGINDGGINNELCTAKSVGHFGQAAGLCPGTAAQAGAWHMAGLAYAAHTQDLRSDRDGAQMVRTMAVELGSGSPAILVPSNLGIAVRITPEHRLLTAGTTGSLVDLRRARAHTEIDPAQVVDGRPAPTPGAPFPSAQAGSGVFHAKYVVVWDDSQQGGDFDNDLWGTLDYVLDTRVSPATLSVTTNLVSESSVGGQLFGFTLQGTTLDGFHAYSGSDGANYADDGAVPGCSNCRALSESGGQRGPQTHTFELGESSAVFPPTSMQLTAKWGAFDDHNGNEVPDLRPEWDVRDQHGHFTADDDGDGQPDGDGVPDGYINGDPWLIEGRVRDALEALQAYFSMSPVLVSSTAGRGAVYQSLFHFRKSDSTAARNVVRWVGGLVALHRDQDGYMREDYDGDARLDGYDVDPVVEIFYDELDQRYKFRRYMSASSTVFNPVEASPPLELENLRTLWNGRERLSDLDATTIVAQRAWSTAAGSEPHRGRHLLTWLDHDLDGLVALNGSETMDFTAATFTTDERHRWLDEADPLAAARLVDWVRGAEQDGLRSRRLDYDGDEASGGDPIHPASGNPEVMRLGDSPHHLPVVVGAPDDDLGQFAAQLGYDAFRDAYAGRRQVVYVGANDGLLHAFNGGFYQPAERRFALSPDGETAHPLGAEIWAYAPRNLLPHLQWLARPDYTHVAYLDGSVQSFDARIFVPSATHPNGWGTVLIAAMRFGGGAAMDRVTLDIDGDGTDDFTTRSAYVVLDVTDPEEPPRVLAELAPEGLGYTTSSPAVVPLAGGDGTVNRWYLVFGSGPDDSSMASASQAPKLFVYDLVALVQGDYGPQPAAVWNLPDAMSFVGDIAVADLDRDSKAEALYFGVSGGVDGTQGGLYRLSIAEQHEVSAWGMPFRVLANANQPFTTRPTVAPGPNQTGWVVAGSGRLLVDADRASQALQTLYGFLDPNAPENSASTMARDALTLLEVGAAAVRSNGDVDIDDDGNIDTTLASMTQSIALTGGWKRRYLAAGGSAERGVGPAVALNGMVYQVSHTPATLSCDISSPAGVAALTLLDLETGVPDLALNLGEQPCAGCPSGVYELRAHSIFGLGLLTDVPPGLLPYALFLTFAPPSPPIEQVPTLPLIALLALALVVLLAAGRLGGRERHTA